MEQDNIQSSPLTEGAVHGILSVTGYVYAPLRELTQPPPFDKLVPAEIRNMIWKYLVPGPRMVKVYLVPILNGESQMVNGERVYNSYLDADTNPVPTPLFHICSESRKLALKHYESAFEKELGEENAEWRGKLKLLAIGGNSDWVHYSAMIRPLTALEQLTVEQMVPMETFVYPRNLVPTQSIGITWTPERIGIMMESAKMQFGGFWHNEIAKGWRDSAPENVYLTRIQLLTKADTEKAQS